MLDRSSPFVAPLALLAGVERRVNLSSIRTPRMGARDRAPEPWAQEAKEFLRCVMWCFSPAAWWLGCVLLVRMVVVYVRATSLH